MPALKYWDGSAWQYVFPTGAQAAGGELSGFFPNPKLKPKYYALGTLPIVGEEGEIAVVEVVDPAVAGLSLVLMRYSGTISPAGWYTIGRGRAAVAAGVPSTLTAATGWRKPTTTVSMTFPYAGVWLTKYSAFIQLGAADTQVGCGISKSTDSGTASPTLGYATSGGHAANARVYCPAMDETAQIGAAGDIWDMRFYSVGSTAITPQRGIIYAEPLRLTGLV